MIKYRYEKYIDLNRQKEQQPDNAELVKKAAVAEEEYIIYKKNVKKVEVEEKKEKELKTAYGDPNAMDENEQEEATEEEADVEK